MTDPLIQDGNDIPNAPNNLKDKILLINPDTKEIIAKIPKRILAKYDDTIENSNNFFIDAYLCFENKKIIKSSCIHTCKYISFCEKAKKLKTKTKIKNHWKRIMSNKVEPELLKGQITNESFYTTT